MLEHRRYLLMATYGLYVYERGPTSALGWNLLAASGLVLLNLVLLVALVLDREPNNARMALATASSGAIVYTLLEPRQ